MITVKQNVDANGSLDFVGATSLTVMQTSSGLRVIANDVIAPLPIDNSTALQAKIDKALAALLP